MPWAKGQSGNPAGRPPNSRALTELLKKALAKTIEVDGKRISGSRFVAQAVAEGITTARVTMPDGSSWTLEPKDWMELVKWAYVHIDGPAKTESRVDLSGALALTVVEEIVDATDADRPLTPDSA